MLPNAAGTANSQPTQRKYSDWMDPINKIKFFHAFKTKADTVVLRDGRVFTLDFNHTPGQVLVKPKRPNTHVPMGFFNLEKCSDPIWLELNGADQPDSYNILSK